MFQVDLPHLDAKEAAAVTRRRRLEEERKARIFNPRQRLIGKDLCALRIQIEEKRAREEKERALDEAWVREGKRQLGLIAELQRRSDEDKIKAWKDVQEFRKTQRFEDRREFDLNEKRKLAYAARLHDEDVRNGPASMQKFEGEDLSYKGRLDSQEMQKKAWLDAQIAERKQNEQEYREADRMYQDRLREQSLRVNELANGEWRAKKAVEKAYREYNCALAQEVKERKELQKQAEEEANLAHKLNMYHSELLTEVTDATTVNGPFRIGRDRFKGFSEAQIKTIKEEQLRQGMEKKQRDMDQRAQDKAWDKMKARYDLAMNIMDKEIQSREQDKRLEMININRELAEEQRVRRDYVNNCLFKGTVTEAFYDQFNTTTR